LANIKLAFHQTIIAYNVSCLHLLGFSGRHPSFKRWRPRNKDHWDVWNV